MKKYRKKPLVIGAVEIDRYITRHPIVGKQVEKHLWTTNDTKRVHYLVKTSEGDSVVTNLGDFIICGIEGEVYPCKRSVFLKTYEEVVTKE